MSDSGKAVFLSYASQDAEAAKRICDALRASGVEVWFDQNELVGGDAWDAKIRGHIKTCTLFVPIISANTNARREGYFRREWKLAVDRTHDMDEALPFLVPVVIDDTTDAGAFVPEKFREVQWTRLKGGETPQAFCARVKKLLSGEQGAGSREPRTNNPQPRTNNRSPRPRWLLPVLGGVGVAVIALVIGRPWQNPAANESQRPAGQSGASGARANVSPARVIADRAFALAKDMKSGAPALNAALKEAERAAAMDETDGELWAIAALVDLSIYERWVDHTDPRREAVHAKLVKAKGLAPRSALTRYAEAKSFIRFEPSAASLAAALEILDELRRENPREFPPAEILGLIGVAQQAQGKYDEAARSFDLAGINWANAGSWACLLGGNLTQALAMAERVATVDPVNGLLQVALVHCSRGDRAAQRATLDRLPAAARLEETARSMDLDLAYVGRDADALLKATRAYPTSYVGNFTLIARPRGYYAGLAYAWLGRPEAARLEWAEALRQLEAAPPSKVTINGGDIGMGDWPAMTRMYFLAQLGRKEEAERELKVYREREHEFWLEPPLVGLLVLLGHPEEAIDEMERQLVKMPENRWLSHARFRFDPELDPLRGNPRFEKLLRDYLPKGAKPFEDQLSASDLKPSTSNLAPDNKSVAVLAFANHSDDKGNEYFSDGISEELLNVLAKVPGLKVTARTSSFHFKGKDTPISEIAKQLGVAYVVEGSVRKSGDKVRITAQLIKASDGFHVWSETFTRELKDVFAVQDEIAGLIAKNLELKMGAVRAADPLALNPAAFELYTQARQAFNASTPEDLQRAEQLLTRTLELESGSARVYALLSDVLRNLAQGARTAGTFTQRDGAVMSDIMGAARRAVALDPALPEARVALGAAHWMAWRFDEAQQELRAALALNSNLSAGYGLLGRVLLADGRMEEALAAFRRAVELDPFYSRLIDNYSWALTLAGRPTEALQQADRALLLQPANNQARAARAFAVVRQGRSPGPIQQMIENGEMDPAYGASVLALEGKRAQAEDVLRKYTITPRSLIALAALGRDDEFFTLLASGQLPANGIEQVLFNPTIDRLRGDPRFQRVLADLGLTETHARAQAWRAVHPPEKPAHKP